MLTGQSSSRALVLALDEVTLRAGDRVAFPRLGWAIHAGEQWAILGPNGAGKSLLARAIAGEEVPAQGEVRYGWAKSNLSEPPGVALVSPQTHRAVLARESSFYQSRWHSGVREGQFGVSQFLSQDQVEEINPFEVHPRRSPPRGFVRRRHEVLRLLQIEGLWERKLIHLSNGEMRKVLLARALLRAPRLLVLDEPYAGLDVTTRRRLRAVIRHLMRGGLTVVVLTSRPDEVPIQSTHLLLVERHRVLAQGKKPVVLQHPLIQRLLAAAAQSVQRPRFASERAAPLHRHGSVLVALRDVNIRAGRKWLLQGVNWRLRRGEHWALLGPNGSGKTTLLSLIQGDHPQVYAQNVTLFGLSPDSTQALWQARQFVGWLSPELHLHYPPEWNCLDVVCSGYFDSIGLYQPCSPRRRRRARAWLERLGLAASAERPLGELPLGDQRIVLLGRALVKAPRLLILDEPCQGLDQRHRRQLLAVVDETARSTAAGLIFVTHHRDELPQCITHRLRLKAGRVVEQARVTGRIRSHHR